VLLKIENTEIIVVLKIENTEMIVLLKIEHAWIIISYRGGVHKVFFLGRVRPSK